MIYPNDIIAVQLPDGWHGVVRNTFALQPFGIGDAETSQGLTFFSEKNETISGPFSSILAVQVA